MLTGSEGFVRMVLHLGLGRMDGFGGNEGVGSNAG